MPEQFKNLIMTNLKNNGFPQKKVSLPLETLYEKADHKKINLNKILEEIEKNGITVEKTLDKIVFSMSLNNIQQKAMDEA